MIMMTCAEARDRIEPWLSGEMDAGERSALEAHLHACAFCATVAARARRALDLLTDNEVPDPGPLYWASFGRRLAVRIEARARRFRRLRLAAAIAAAVAVVAGLALWRVHDAIEPARLADVNTNGTVPVPQPSPRATGGNQRDVAVAPGPRALTIEEAETRLREALRRAAAEGQSARELDAILEDIAPADSSEEADQVGNLSPEDERRLSEDLLDPRG